MDKPPILLATSFPPRFGERAGERYNVLGPLERPEAGAVTGDRREARALITIGTLKTDAAMLDALPRLEVIACLGSGFEGVDLELARARRITVTHGPEKNADAVADFALGLVLALCLRIPAADTFVRSGQWTRDRTHRMPAVRGLAGARLGVYGLGAIGSRIAARAATFGMEIAYHNRHRRADMPYRYEDRLVDLAAWSGVLVVAARADASNRHAIDGEVLRALGPDGYLVNIARGSAVDEGALIAALEAGAIAGAGLDVFEHEPDVPERLKALDNVVLAPHVAGNTRSAHAALQDLLLANLDAHFGGRPPLTPVPG